MRGRLDFWLVPSPPSQPDQSEGRQGRVGAKAEGGAGLVQHLERAAYREIRRLEIVKPGPLARRASDGVIGVGQ